MIKQNNQANDGTVRYYLAQHMADLLRRETQNVGVLVQRGNEVAARFIGETPASGEIDGRTLRQFANPKLYRMWVHHWRKSLRSPDWEDRLLNDDRKSFAFIPGGEVSEVDFDSTDAICDYLFHMLVSSGGLKEALADEAESSDEADAVHVRDELLHAFRHMGVMRSNPRDGVLHPVMTRQSIPGTNKIWHPVSFLQKVHSTTWAYEPIHITSTQKQKVAERAGYLGLIFGDIQKAASENEQKFIGNVIVSMDSDDEKSKHVKYALSLIRPHAQVVNLRSKSERNELLKMVEDNAVAL
ncbi:hypothetical protein AB1K70_19150 [Bremerella sp. JC770]|uniref:hypothetical protein n=1 Tax=Bremerella sp. JC770 TaxID=3232137 RepID=UPI003459AA2C